MGRFGKILQHRTGRLAAIALAALAIGGGWWWWRESADLRNPELTTPMIALQGLRSNSLYYNGPAMTWLLKHRADLVAGTQGEEGAARVRKFIQAAQNPSLFRQLDREFRFDTLLLVGDPSQSRPLIEHLLTTKDFLPTYLDHTAIVFKRHAPRAWELADFASVRSRFTDSGELAVCLAQAAGKMTALRMYRAADEVLDEAERLAPKSPEVWSSRAVFHMLQGEMKPALENADRALELDPEFLPAMGAKAQILYATKKFDVAWELSKKIIERAPNDPNLLFYHARIAHEARAYQSEIKALEQLIKLAETENMTESGYRIYLAQAHAKIGEGEAALKQLNLALLDRELPDEQRKFAEEMLEEIERQRGLF